MQASPTSDGNISWSDAALALFALGGPTAVRAGAGSGKTTALVELCARLLAGEALGAPCAPHEIVAITFTEKAAAELEERLRAVLARRAAGAAGADRDAWADRLAGLDRMPIGTIHGWCGRLLLEHAVEAGLDPEFTVAEEERSAPWLREAALGAVLAALDAGEPGAVELCAGLGAGEGRGALADVVAGLVRERAWRGASGPPAPGPDRTDEALAGRRTLLEVAAAAVAARAEASTPALRRAVDGLAEALGRLPPSDREGPLDTAVVERLVALAEPFKGTRRTRAGGTLLDLRDALREAAERLPGLVAEPLAAPQRRALAALVGDAERRYGERKQAERAVDFDDLLRGARDLLRADGALRAELRGRYRAFLVDEYQDVNPVQQELFTLLAGPGDPPGPAFVAVGDLKQSIYRFRGADVAVFAGLLSRFEAGGGRVLSLAENHRSVPALLAFANALSARALRPAEAAARPYEITFAPTDALLPRRAGGLSPACELLVDAAPGSSGERRQREARALAARIGALVSGRAGVAVRERAGDGVEQARVPRFGDVAILLRRLTQVAVYERALREAGIPCRLARGGGFYQAPEVRDLGELFASLADPSDLFAWAALLRSPFCALSDDALVRLSRLGLPTLPLRAAEELREAVVDEEERGRLVRFLAAWRELRALRDRVGLGEVLARAVDALDLDAALLAAPDGERRLRNVQKARGLAERFDRGGTSAAEFAAFLRGMATRPPREPEADLEPGEAVAIVSVHQAKGLEWPIVLVPDLGARPRSDGRRAALDASGRVVLSRFDPDLEEWTATASIDEAREEDRRAAAAEARRLLYVAVTRARDYLVLSGEGAGAGEPTWRGLLDAALSEAPAVARAIPIEEAATAAVAPPLAPAPSVAPPSAPREEEPAPLSAIPAPAIRMAVTELAEYARCPRRHLLGHVLGREEPRGDRGGREGDDPARATDRGTLAHAMLAEADLAAPPLERLARVEAAASRRGYDPRSPGVRRIVREVLRFADSPAWAALAATGARGTLRRELPFLLRVDGSAYLVGAIDLLAVDPEAGVVTVVDYKYAVARPGAAERYRFQLLAYALAAQRAHPGFAVRTRLLFLRGDARAVEGAPTRRELDRFAAEAPELVAAAARGDEARSAAELGRTAERCRAEGCGWVAHCHGGEAPGMRLPAGGRIP